MFNMGPMEWVIILTIVLLVFGPKKLPSLGRSVGRTIKEYREGMKEITTALETEEESASVARSAQPAPTAPGVTEVATARPAASPEGEAGKIS